MPEDNQISYEELSAVAERLSQEGRKITLEYVRRALGKGTHSRIAVLLGKWQKEHACLLNESKTARSGSVAIKADSACSNIGTGLRRPNIEGFKSRKPIRQHQTSYSQTKHKQSYSRTQFIGNGNSDESYKSIASCESLSLERLQKESAIIQKLFQALAITRVIRLEALDCYQATQGDLLNTRMECDQKVREFQKSANEQLLALKTEFSRLKTIDSQEIIAIRRQLSL